MALGLCANSSYFIVPEVYRVSPKSGQVLNCNNSGNIQFRYFCKTGTCSYLTESKTFNSKSTWLDGGQLNVWGLNQVQNFSIV